MFHTTASLATTDFSHKYAAPAEALASLSRTLQPLMQQHGLKIEVSRLGEGLSFMADATANPTGAYKIRGALASVLAAKSEGKTQVWTASAGNHGAGVAYASKLLGMTAVVYVPTTAPAAKVGKIKSFGAKVISVGANFDECLERAHDLQRAVGRSSAFVHPFDDRVVAAGQGTIGLELIEHLQHLCDQHHSTRARIFLPIGGGGLCAGVASVVKTLWPRNTPPPEIVGVIDESSPASLLGTFFGRPVRAVPDTIADGTRVALVGETFLSVAPLVDRIMLVPHDAIVRTMRTFYRERGVVLEGAGALGLTGEFMARRYRLFDHISSTVSLALVSGRNVDEDAFQAVITEEPRMNRQTHHRRGYDVELPEREGQLKSFLETVQRFNIASLTYKQQPHARTGKLRVEFEVEQSQAQQLHSTILAAFPGSDRLFDGKQMVFKIGDPVARHYQDELISLDDRPGSFLEYIESLAQSQREPIGSVGFLLYRKPAQPGAKAQVVIGRERTPEPASLSEN